MTILACVSLVIGGHSAFASDRCDGTLLEPDNIQKWIDQKNLKSVAQIVKSLPDCYTANHAMVYHGASLQCATPKAPRMLIFMTEEKSLDRGTVCAFNSGSKEDYAEFYKKDPRSTVMKMSLNANASLAVMRPSSSTTVWSPPRQIKASPKLPRVSPAIH